jgi:hypothetical protein
MRRAKHEHGSRTVRQDLHGFTAEHDRNDAAPPMRRHHDQIARFSRCGIYNGLVGLIMNGMQRIARHAESDG